MANFMFWPVQSRNHALKFIHGKATIGSSGAITLSAADSLGISSITKTSTGLYQVTLAGKFNKLLDCHIVVEDGSTTTAITHFQITANTVSTDGKFSFQCNAPTSSSVTTPAATNPASGAVLKLSILVSNSSVSK